MKKILSALLIALGLALAVPSPTPASNQIYPIQGLAWLDEDGSYRNHCTAWARKIEVPQVGTFIHWVTAGHCIVDEDGNPDLDRDYRIAGKRAYPISMNAQLDLAELSGPENVDGLSVEDVKNAPRVGKDPIWSEGHPFGWLVTVHTEGYVAAQLEEGYYLLQLPVAPGDSGAPVLNKRGRVIGMVQNTFCQGFWQGFCPVGGGSDLKALRFYFRLD